LGFLQKKTSHFNKKTHNTMLNSECYSGFWYCNFFTEKALCQLFWMAGVASSINTGIYYFSVFFLAFPAEQGKIQIK